MKNSIFMKGLSLVLTLVMIFALVPAFSVSADAAENWVKVNSESELAAALKKSAYIYVGTSFEVTGDYTIPAGTTLLVPYSTNRSVGENAAMPYANAAVKDNNSNAAAAGDKNTYCTLTLNGGTLTVNGNLILGGEFSSVPNSYAGQTCGAHGDIKMLNNAQIIVSGVISSYGFIYTGDASDCLITVKSGADVYEPFVVADYAGGSYTVLAATSTSASDPILTPFSIYAMINIQSDMDIQSGASLIGYCDLFTNATSNTYAQHNITSVEIIGSGNALYNLASGTVAHMEYDADKAIALRNKIGQTIITFDGDVSMGYISLKMTIKAFKNTFIGTINVDVPVDITTQGLDFPVPYNYNLKQASGSFIIPADASIKLMPGANLEIQPGANLNVNGRFLVYDGSSVRENGANFNGKLYPSGSALSGSGFPEAASLIVNGSMNIAGSATFAGKIQSNGCGVVYAASGAKLSATAIEGVKTGDTYSYMGQTVASESDGNRVEYKLTAQVADCAVDSWIAVKSGINYIAVSGKAISGTTFGSNVSYDAAQNWSGEWADLNDVFVVAASFDAKGKMLRSQAGKSLNPNSITLTGDLKVFMLDPDTFAPLGDKACEIKK